MMMRRLAPTSLHSYQYIHRGQLETVVHSLPLLRRRQEVSMIFFFSFSCNYEQLKTQSWVSLGWRALSGWRNYMF